MKSDDGGLVFGLSSRLNLQSSKCFRVRRLRDLLESLSFTGITGAVDLGVLSFQGLNDSRETYSLSVVKPNSISLRL